MARLLGQMSGLVDMQVSLLGRVRVCVWAD